MILLATAIAIRDGRLLLVASRYPNQAQPLWNLPGGRQKHGELLAETAVRELNEETGLDGDVVDLAYVSESYDGNEHYLNAAFVVAPHETPAAGASARNAAGDHVVAVEWVALDEIARRMVVAVVREPLLAYLQRTPAQRYAGYHDAGIMIEWPADSD